ncbi:hypothetical protein Pan241w_07950 [Gimesia alba]|uniref:Uncharacterized protein n=1 Tax=Gimesia alba TaxID=2527973 RepID=A0A517RA16_9PLAN|nr:hypothetical protein [Gimesia alba]QDT40737.1 hypothetical protein Pan241w_07950 [Gimesia alba]
MRNLTPCFLSLSLLLVACENQNSPAPVSSEKKVTSEDVKKEIGEAVDTTKEFTKEKRDEYARQINQKLDDLNKKIAELEAKGDKLKEDAKTKWNERLKNLKQNRDQMSQQLEEFNKSSADAWDGLKRDLDIAWTNLKQAYDKTAEEVKE